jgi:hypothetical protein
MHRVVQLGAHIEQLSHVGDAIRFASTGRKATRDDLSNDVEMFGREAELVCGHSVERLGDWVAGLRGAQS